MPPLQCLSYHVHIKMGEFYKIRQVTINIYTGKQTRHSNNITYTLQGLEGEIMLYEIWWYQKTDLPHTEVDFKYISTYDY